MTIKNISMFRTLFIKIAIGLFSVWYLSCNGVGSSKNEIISKSYKHVRIIINSPYSCYNEINLDNTGAGISIFGFRNSNQSDRIKSKKDFSISSDNDKKRIDDIINTIASRSPISSPYMDDGYRFILTINDKQYIDVYGQDSLLSHALKIVAPYIQNDVNNECDFFTLFKRTLQ